MPRNSWHSVPPPSKHSTIKPTCPLSQHIGSRSLPRILWFLSGSDSTEWRRSLVTLNPDVPSGPLSAVSPYRFDRSLRTWQPASHRRLGRPTRPTIAMRKSEHMSLHTTLLTHTLKRHLSLSSRRSSYSTTKGVLKGEGALWRYRLR